MKNISGIKRIAFGIIASLMKAFVDRIKDPELKGILAVQFEEPISAFHQVLTDNDPNDVDQIKQVWREISGDFKNTSLDNLDELIKIVIDDEETEETLLLILENYRDLRADGYKTPPLVNLVSN